MADKIEDGGPAFPFNAADHGYEPSSGMSLRDWFAGQAMQQGMAVLTSGGVNVNEYQIGNLARVAYLASDAMLKARKGEL